MTYAINSQVRMTMTRVVALLISLITVCSSTLPAQTPETLEQARALASKKNKPILLEFFHEG
jgi:hypothetical protein